VPFWNQSIYQGPIASAHPELGDLSFVVGFAVSAALYWALWRASPRLRRL
jgi:NCS1 family nucleobase:cation symporter-1